MVRWSLYHIITQQQTQGCLCIYDQGKQKHGDEDEDVDDNEDEDDNDVDENDEELSKQLMCGVRVGCKCGG